MSLSEISEPDANRIPDLRTVKNTFSGNDLEDPGWVDRNLGEDDECGVPGVTDELLYPRPIRAGIAQGRVTLLDDDMEIFAHSGVSGSGGAVCRIASSWAL